MMEFDDFILHGDITVNNVVYTGSKRRCQSATTAPSSVRLFAGKRNMAVRDGYGTGFAGILTFHGRNEWFAVKRE